MKYDAVADSELRGASEPDQRRYKTDSNEYQFSVRAPTPSLLDDIIGFSSSFTICVYVLTGSASVRCVELVCFIVIVVALRSRASSGLLGILDVTMNRNHVAQTIS